MKCQRMLAGRSSSSPTLAASLLGVVLADVDEAGGGRRRHAPTPPGSKPLVTATRVTRAWSPPASAMRLRTRVRGLDATAATSRSCREPTPRRANRPVSPRGPVREVHARCRRCRPGARVTVTPEPASAASTAAVRSRAGVPHGRVAPHLGADRRRRPRRGRRHRTRSTPGGCGARRWPATAPRAQAPRCVARSPAPRPRPGPANRRARPPRTPFGRSAARGARSRRSAPRAGHATTSVTTASASSPAWAPGRSTSIATVHLATMTAAGTPIGPPGSKPTRSSMARSPSARREVRQRQRRVATGGAATSGSDGTSKSSSPSRSSSSSSPLANRSSCAAVARHRRGRVAGAPSLPPNGRSRRRSP